MDSARTHRDRAYFILAMSFCFTFGSCSRSRLGLAPQDSGGSGINALGLSCRVEVVPAAPVADQQFGIRIFPMRDFSPLPAAAVQIIPLLGTPVRTGEVRQDDFIQESHSQSAGRYQFWYEVSYGTERARCVRSIEVLPSSGAFTCTVLATPEILNDPAAPYGPFRFTIQALLDGSPASARVTSVVGAQVTSPLPTDFTNSGNPIVMNEVYVSSSGTSTLIFNLDDSAGRVASCSKPVTVNLPVPPQPGCVLSASRDSIRVGESVTLSLLTWIGVGDVRAIYIDSYQISSVPPSYPVTPRVPGLIPFAGRVYGTTGVANCSVSVTVLPAPVPPPTCTLSSSLASVTRGDSVTLTLTWTNDIQSAQLDGPVTLPTNGSKVVTKPVTPQQTSVYAASVVGRNETVACQGSPLTVTVTPQAAVHTIFVTSQAYSGAFGALSIADSTCQRVADAPGSLAPRGIYMAILSDADDNAKDRLAITKDIYNLDPNPTLRRVASSTSLWSGMLEHAVIFDEKGIAVSSNAEVWTYSRPDGTRLIPTNMIPREQTERNTNYITRGYAACRNWTFGRAGGEDYIQTGIHTATNGRWLDRYEGNSQGRTHCDHLAHLYCISQ